MWRLVFLVLLLRMILVTVRGQDRFWTRMTGTNNADTSNSIALDSTTGDLYVAGSTGQTLHGEPWVGADDIFLMKYSTSGTRIWTRMVGLVGSDLGLGVAVDSTTCAVYVTGQISGAIHGQTSAGGADIITMKYSGNGTRIWTKMAGSSSGDIGQSVSVDPKTPAVYITGYTSGNLNGQVFLGASDAFLMRYGTDGSLVWTKVFGSAATDVGYGVSVDLVNGDVYVAGTLASSLDGEPFIGALDIFLSRFDSSGTRMWTRMSGGAGNDIAYAVVVDGNADTVHICGGARSGLHGEPFADVSSYDIFVMKYLRNGNRVWTRMVGTATNDLCQGVAVDKISGTSYIVGFVGGIMHGQTNVGSSDIAIVSFASNGTRQWTRTLGTIGSDRAQGVAMSADAGRLYVSGAASDSIDSEVYVSQTDNIVMSYSIPSCQPSSQPSRQPSGQPSIQPASQPSRQPTSQPSMQPSLQPFGKPSSQPSTQPTSQPSMQPSLQPFGKPSSQPSTQPTSQPSMQPSLQPFGKPSSQPSTHPTSQPSMQPSLQPFGKPSSQPSTQPSSQPSVQPTGQPSSQPSRLPSSQPASMPTTQPSMQPSMQPSQQPSSQPSTQPSSQPVGKPSGQPSLQPSCQPSCQPTGQPSIQPSSLPFSEPSGQPSSQPSVQPSVQPHGAPTGRPSTQPSSQPSGEPSGLPTGQPTAQPSSQPLSKPSTQPSSQPSRQPTCHPSTQPSLQPISKPTAQPSMQPFSFPSVQPSTQPSSRPSRQPSSQPSGQPSRQPYSTPSGQPTAQPSFQPADQPTCKPTAQPFSQPTGQPSKQPTSRPSRQPTGKPSRRLVTQLSSSPSFALSVSCMPTVSAIFFPSTGNASSSLGILTGLVNSTAAVVIVSDSVRLVSQVLPNISATSSLSVSLPLTEAERALQAAGILVLPSISLVTSNTSSDSSLYVAVVVLSSSLWVPVSTTGNSSSKNTSNVGQLLSDVVTVVTVGEGVSFVDIGFPAGTISHFNSSPPINFTIYCPPRYVFPKSFYCNDTGYIERVQCNGLASVVRGTCPRLQEACAALDLSSMTVARDNLCETTRQNRTTGSNSTSGSDLLCRCTLGEGLNVPGSNMIAAGVVLGLGTSDLSKTFQASSSFGDGSAASKAAIVLSVFASVWGLALFFVVYFYNWNAKGTKHAEKGRHSNFVKSVEGVADLNEEHVDAKELGYDKVAERKAELMQKLAKSYVATLFPAVFQPSSFLEGLCREVYGKHMYINFFFRLHHSHNPIVDIIKVVTLQSFLLFLLALLYDLNVPSDDGSCKDFTLRRACLQRRLFFDPSQTYCQWTAFQYADLLNTDDDAVYFECIYGDPVVSLTAATYTSMIMSLATCLLMDPLEYILSLLAAPTLVNDARAGSTMIESSRNDDSSHRKASTSLRLLPVHLVSAASNLSRLMASAKGSKSVVQEEVAIHLKEQSADAARFYSAELLEAAVLAHRSRLISNGSLSAAERSTRLLLFDRAWHLDSNTGVFSDVSIISHRRWHGRMNKVSPEIKRAVNNHASTMHVLIQEELYAVQHDTLEIIDELAGQTQTELGFEIVVQFVRDVLGSSTAAARIFALKIDMDCEKLQRVSLALKAFICFLLLCLNGLFFYFTILRGISKGLVWQRSYLIAWLLQSAVDICVFETMQVAWFHYFIPSLVKKEVARARKVFEDISAKAVDNMQGLSLAVDSSELNAADYLYVSNHLAREYPHCIESFLIKQYRSTIPGKTAFHLTSAVNEEPNEHLAEDDVESNLQTGQQQHVVQADQAVETSCRYTVLLPVFCFQRCFVLLGSAAVSVILQVVVAAPLELQSLFIRAIEPVVLSGVMFLFLLVSTRPAFLAATIVLLACLVGSAIWEHVSTLSEQREVAISAGVPIVHAAAAVVPDINNLSMQDDVSYSLGSISGDFSSDYSSSHRYSDQSQNQKDDNEDSISDQVRAAAPTGSYCDEFILDEAYSMSSSSRSSCSDDS